MEEALWYFTYVFCGFDGDAFSMILVVGKETMSYLAVKGFPVSLLPGFSFFFILKQIVYFDLTLLT